MKTIRNTIIGTGMLFLLHSCMTYREFPAELLESPPAGKSYDRLMYRIKEAKFNLGGYRSLRRTLMYQSPFRYTEYSVKIPTRGLFCDIAIEDRKPTVTAITFGLISILTLTYLPAWSGDGGYYFTFRLYRDGKFLHSYEYDAYRRWAIWAPLIPFAWVNFFTNSESEVFKAVTLKFFKDAEKHFVAPPAPVTRPQVEPPEKEVPQ